MDQRARTVFETRTQAGEASIQATLTASRLNHCKADDDALRLAAMLAHAAFSAPDRIAVIYDAAAEGFLRAPVIGPEIATPARPAVSIPEAFWRDFWSLVDDSAGLGSADATRRTAALGAHVNRSLLARGAAACLAYPGVARAAEAGFPERIRLVDLAACPPGSLGAEFHRLIVDNGFDLEVLDREALGLKRLPPPLDYLNARMLQTHDLWHIVAGYQTTKLHEVAISGFQMAQFGHGYSAMFLAMLATATAVRRGDFRALMNTILSAWVHGRRTPPMLLIPWEAVWGDSTAAIRERFGVEPYNSPYPADAVERAEAAA